MTKRLLDLVITAALLLTLSGCSFAAFDAKSLMAPPKANEDQQAIHKLLQGNLPDVTFIYPKTGDYRSAIVMEDFTGDGADDAIGFTSLGDTGGVQVRFLVKNEGKWETAASFQNSAIQVDRVCFADFTGRGTPDVLIGWGSTSGTSGRTAAANVYAYENGEVTEHSLGVYGELAVTDFDRDGVSEVFTVDKFVPAATEEDEPTPAVAKVYRYTGATMQEQYIAAADNSIASYQSAVFGKLNQTLWGVALDGAKADGSVTTQIFYLQNDALVNAPEGVNTEEYNNPFTRPSAASFQSRDINGDAMIELPSVTLLPGISEDVTPDSTSFLVQWRRWQRNGGSLLGTRALLNTGENYWFRLPYQLEGRITASNDAARRTVTYTAVTRSEETDEPLLGETLFSVRVFTRAAWENRGEIGGYEALAVQNDLVYGMQVRTSDPEMTGYIHEIKQSFSFLSE